MPLDAEMTVITTMAVRRPARHGKLAVRPIYRDLTKSIHGSLAIMERCHVRSSGSLLLHRRHRRRIRVPRCDNL